MHARSDVRDALIELKMRHWLTRARYPYIDPRCPAWRARKNYWRLVDKYPELAAKYGYQRRSVYGL
jgi:hypothetical protein